MRVDIAIIGSGISGLTAALLCAKKGLKTVLIDRSPHPAPLLKRFKRNNVYCDIGIHYSGGFSDSGCMTTLFNYLGIMDKINPVPMNPNGFDIIKLDGKDYPIPVGYNNVQEALKSYFPESSRAIEVYIDEIKKIQDITPFLNFKMNAESIASFDPDLRISLAEFMYKNGAKKDLIDFLGNYGFHLYGGYADDYPFFIHAMILGSFFKSSHTFNLGGDEIVDAFVSELGKNSVDIILNNAVSKINVGDRRKVSGVTLASGEKIESRIVISTIHPHILYDLLPEEVNNLDLFASIKSMKNTECPFMLYLDYDELPKNVYESNIYLFDKDNHTKENLAILITRTDKDKFPKKGLSVFKQGGDMSLTKEQYYKHDKKYYEQKNIETNNLLDEFLHVFPDMKSKVRILDSASSYTFEKWTSAPCGSAYGLKFSINQQRMNCKTPLRGLFLAGQSVNTPGIMGAVISSFIAVSNMLGIYEIWEDIQKSL